MRADYPRVRVVAAGALLAGFWLAPPVRLQPAGSEVSSDVCLTLADRPPSGGSSALPLLEGCAALLPDDSELLRDLASAYEAAGRGPDAERTYRLALAHDPWDGPLHVALAKLLQARGALDEAHAHAQVALRIQPNRPAVLRLVADLDRAALDHAGRRR
jgi:tetratricopeptide (TPR) repeat protein